MKKIAFLLLSMVSIAYGDDRTDSAVRFYLTTHGNWDSTDTVLVTQLDFKASGGSQVLLTYSKASQVKHVGHDWTVLEIKNGQWIEPKTRNRDGTVQDSSEVFFEPEFAGFVYLDKYQHTGVLTYFEAVKSWSFTYLENDTLKTVQFKASQIGMTDAQLEQLRTAHKITVERRNLSQH